MVDITLVMVSVFVPKTFALVKTVRDNSTH